MKHSYHRDFSDQLRPNCQIHPRFRSRTRLVGAGKEPRNIVNYTVVGRYRYTAATAGEVTGLRLR